MSTTDKQTLLHNIFEGLRINLKLSQDLWELLEEEGLALRKMDTQKLFTLSKNKEQLLAKVQYLDASLKEMSDDLSQYFDTPKSQETNQKSIVNKLSQIAPKLSSEHGDFIINYKETLTKLRQEIMAKNLLNKRFTEETLSCLSDAISLISRPAPINNLYAMHGAAPIPTSCQPSFISKEV